MLSPRFIYRDGRRIGEVEAPHSRLHGNVDHFGDERGAQNFVGKANRFGTEEQAVVVLIFDICKPLLTFVGEGENPAGLSGFEPGAEIFVDDYDGSIAIIHSCPTQLLVVESESERLDEMKAASDVGRQPHTGPGVGGDLRSIENEIEQAAPSAGEQTQGYRLRKDRFLQIAEMLAFVGAVESRSGISGTDEDHGCIGHLGREGSNEGNRTP